MFEIKNVKISLKIITVSLNSVLNYLDKNHIEYQTKSNYVIISSIYIYILFKPKNQQITHVNVTKIPNLFKVDDAVNHFKNDIFPAFNVQVNKISVDNITAVFHVKKCINLPEIIKNKKPHFKITYNNEKFPGMFIKFDVGTLIIFYTGKVIAVGCKNTSNLDYLFCELVKICDHE